MINKLRGLFLLPFFIAVCLFVLIDLLKRRPIIFDGKEYAKEVLEILPIDLDWMVSSLFWILILTIILN